MWVQSVPDNVSDMWMSYMQMGHIIPDIRYGRGFTSDSKFHMIYSCALELMAYLDVRLQHFSNLKVEDYEIFSLQIFSLHHLTAL